MLCSIGRGAEKLNEVEVLLLLSEDLVPESWVTLCSIGPGIAIVDDEEVVSCARALLVMKPRRQRVREEVDFIFDGVGRRESGGGRRLRVEESLGEKR